MEEAQETLYHVFGHQAFRPGRITVISALLSGRSASAVFPTGGGKSLCYQLPALMLDGLTVVVSPLIALMKDQVDALVSAASPPRPLIPAWRRRRPARSTQITPRPAQVVVSFPGAFVGRTLVETLSRCGVALLAIDEAHCISEWGHNFRPEYLKLADIATRLRAGRVLALTATATPAVVLDIASALGVADNDVVVTGFHRPNLELRATPCRADQRLDLLLNRLP